MKHKSFVENLPVWQRKLILYFLVSIVALLVFGYFKLKVIPDLQSKSFKVKTLKESLFNFDFIERRKEYFLREPFESSNLQKVFKNLEQNLKDLETQVNSNQNGTR